MRYEVIFNILRCTLETINLIRSESDYCFVEGMFQGDLYSQAIDMISRPCEFNNRSELEHPPESLEMLELCEMADAYVVPTLLYLLDSSLKEPMNKDEVCMK